ncbi:MAG: hypothetical protein ACYS5V_15015, partial [Planctomycetota bacterium]
MRIAALFVVVTAAVALTPLSAWAGDGAAGAPRWEPIGFSGNGGMYSAAISPVDPKLMMVN